MKSITIHKLDDATEERLVARARSEGVSLNQLVKRLLRESLGVHNAAPDHRRDFAAFCGRWSEQEAEEFDRAVAGFDEIDEEVWR
ncbi:FitA-like ribbon-helix-helix domain-containing protein [Haloferula sp. A504]|uniref:FitA-like ribbon-helix-helix domain-containing protein n=1 Tax=Haloferula sp. A504 TaxID=3373601 RepID=UPI0031C66DC9|nr:hypothetical protein [Verrucomicrobiaceae bacterium E54]